MLHDGNSRAVLQFLVNHYGDLIYKLGLDIFALDSDEIRVTKYPPSFMEFMENQGYCNRDRFDTYKPCDVLSYVVMAANNLFDGRLNMMIRDELQEGSHTFAKVPAVSLT